MNSETAAIVTYIFVWVGAVAFGASAIIYGVFGRWKETAVGVFYLVLLAAVSIALLIAGFARGIPPEVRVYIGPIIYGIFAATGLGTLPTVTKAVFKERRRRRRSPNA